MTVKHIFKNDAIGKDGITCAEISSFKGREIEIYYWKDEDLITDMFTAAVLRIKTIKHEHNKRQKTGRSFPNMEDY
jgi:hypothetical protein